LLKKKRKEGILSLYGSPINHEEIIRRLNMANIQIFNNRKPISGNISEGKGMKFHWLNLLMAGFVLWAFSGTVWAGKEVSAQHPGKTPSVKASQPTRKPITEVTAKKWTGDLDGMIQRRVIRALVPYSKTFYFNDRGTERGLAYELLRSFEADLNKNLKTKNVRVYVVFLPVSRDKFIPYLREGKGDIAVGNLTITPQRLKEVDFSKPTNRDVSEIVVTGPAAKPVARKEDLSGQVVYIRKSSSFYESLEQLNTDFVKRKKAPVKIRLASESLEVEDLLEMVNAGLVKSTIVDSYIGEFWKQVYPKIVLNTGAAVRTGGETGWMFRQKSPKLKAAVDKFLTRYSEGSKERNILLQKYLKNTKYVKEATSPAEIAKFEKVIDYFRKYGSQYDIDFLLMMAQGYQESRLDHKARSKAGAIGIMQVMPATGKELKVGDIRQLEPNIQAGVKYIRFMVDQYYKDEPMDPLNKGLFAFAAYNAGPNRIDQFRKLANKRKLDPNVWFNNVELIAAEKIGRETVTYVANIFKYYLAYQLIVEEEKAHQEAINQMKKETK
jgi:membrane-bound lytic murein transglycosylase MltF